MFAKLRKKIETEGGTLPITDGARPRRSESVTSLTGVGNSSVLSAHGRDPSSPAASVTSEDPVMKDVTSTKDDVVALLQKKTEQCRKMEGNISDLAALIKDKSKTIEKLETSLKQQDEIVAKKLQEQKEEFESQRSKLVQGFQADRVKLDQLLNTEQELDKCRGDLESKWQRCQVAESQVEKLTDEMGPLKKRLQAAETDNQRLKDENSERAELVTMLSKEKAVFDKRLGEMNHELTQRQSQCNALQAKLAELEETYKTLARNSDLQQNKSNKSLTEKDDLIDTLRERVGVLEQRIADSSLSGDDKTTALETERSQLELKLTEARQQLTEIKSTWSDKITHLEEQISHLNTKIAEDGEEISNHQKSTDQMRDSFEKQIEGLRKQLEEAEKRALENFESAASKDSHYEKQLMELESRLAQEKLKAKDAETHSRSEVSGLQMQLEEMKAGSAEKDAAARDTIARLEQKQMASETAAMAKESEIQELQASLSQKEQEVNSLKKEVDEKDVSGAYQTSTITTLHGRVHDLETARDKILKERNNFEMHLKNSQDEKVGLLEKNADLYCQMEALKKSESESRQEHQRTLTLKAEADESSRRTEKMLRTKIESLESQIEQSELCKAESGLYSTRIDEMTDTIASLESQLVDKSRTVKKQEQMLKDLRVTLQRELKVQALPGDDNPHDMVNNTSFSTTSSCSSPSSNRQRGTEKSQKSSDPPSSSSLSSFLSMSSSSSSSSSSSAAASSSSNRFPSSHSTHQNNNNSHHPTTAAATASRAPSKGSGPPYPATLPFDSFHSLTAGSLSVTGGANLDSLMAHTNNVKRELEKDVNFQYLKHVVLKFMLSREAEAIQLIKAVSMLLNFSTQEQQLMKETLEWKMSWFGARPPVGGKGQTSKR